MKAIPGKPPRRMNIARQAGAALLLFVLMMLLAASSMLLAKLNSPTNRISRQYASMDALQEARAALIGYAVTYPETHSGQGPGFLPCPDSNNDGMAGGSCALSPKATTVGRLPYKTLEISKVRDHAGEPLWYAVADNYRNNPKTVPLNSETRGDFRVDGRDDIVAVIFAPGPPLPGQNRSNEAQREEVANYLEDDNANGDVNFTTRAGGAFNDTLLTISRQQLMAEVERRVLGDVDTAVSAYRADYDAYPWLSPFSNLVNAAPFRGQARTKRGHLPYHYSGGEADAYKECKSKCETIKNWKRKRQCNQGCSLESCLDALQRSKHDGRGSFEAEFALSWHSLSTSPQQLSPIRKRGGPSQKAGGYDTPYLSAGCLQDISNCDEGRKFPDIDSLTINTRCSWPQVSRCPGVDPRRYKNILSCQSASVTATPRPVPYRSQTCRPGKLQRTYAISFPTFMGQATINEPSKDSVRTRAFTLNAARPARINWPTYRTPRIVMDHTYSEGQLFNTNTGRCEEGTFTVSRYFDLAGYDKQGKIEISGLQYDLDVDDGELPAWFIANDWQRLIYLAYAPGEPLPGAAGKDCRSLGRPCLQLQAKRMIDGAARPVMLHDGVRALALSAGADLTASRHPTDRPRLRHYFEDDNRDGGLSFERKRIATQDYNDHTRIIETAPPPSP